MGHIKIIAEFFLVSLGLTLTLFSPIANSQLTGNGFIKLISNLSIGSLVIALIVSCSDSAMNFFSTPNLLKEISIIALILITLFHKEKKSILMWLLYALIVSALTFHILRIAQLVRSDLLTEPNALNFYFLLGSSLLLGVITYAMTLGHWYLVVPKLSEKPLLVAAILTWVILFLKVMLSTYSLRNNVDFFSEMTTLGSGYAFNWMLLLMRTLFGYVVIFGMSYFNWRLVRMRSIQSSTGVLYAMTFFVFIGELISSFMFFNYGLLI